MADAKKIVEGLQILMKHGEVAVDAQHDILCAGPGIDGELTDEEKAKLVELGWHWDEECDSWAHFT